MFENSPLFAIMQQSNRSKPPVVQRFELDRDTRAKTSLQFGGGVKRLRENEDGTAKIAHEFYEDYAIRPEDGEYMQIENYELPSEVYAAIDNPTVVDCYEANDDSELPLIRALFMGELTDEGCIVAFQRVKSEQYLLPTGIHLLWSRGVMRDAARSTWLHPEGRSGLTISSSIDCVFDSGKLQFVSSYYAKQVLDLTEYYREAELPEILEFAKSEYLLCADPDAFASGADSYERRKIASIRKNKILEQHDADEIAGYAHQIGVNIEVNGGRIVFPEDKARRKLLLGFLDEDVYRGMFSDELYQTNSKRRTK